MNIEIIKYNEHYAARVADMWNHSRDGWGGANTVDTEETIIHRERNSSNIHTFLAMEGEKVVGYCGLSEYRDDEGALYIPLLNVRDDYHGKKIGKKLLLTALQEAIDLKWPRLDLYTWPGNTKAVPLYKKCGFFWEDRDDTTHLMNFMPTVLHTEAVQDFFKNTNWYDSSSKEIEVKPDGRVENDFHYYEYTWENDQGKLRMEFEKTGRGIRLIETDDYLISATVDQHQLVFGNHYQIRYTLKNKTGKPLHITLSGISDKNIEFTMEESLDITESKEITKTFKVGAIEEEQNSLRTHPTVQSVVHINGKKAIFKVGILPKYPAQVSVQLSEDLTFIGKQSNFYIDIMNNFREKVRFQMEFPASPLLNIKSEHLSVTLESKERISVPVEFVANSHGFYNADLQIYAIKENGEEVHFARKIGFPIRGIGAQFHGVDNESIQLYNGQYFATINKDENEIFAGRRKKDDVVMIMTPKVGKPYSEEISKAKPLKKDFFTGVGFIGTKITYGLAAFPSINLHYIIKLYSEGLVEHYYEVENKLDEVTEQPVWINQSIYLGLEKALIPYQNEIVEMNDSIGNFYEYWDESQITENWIFVKNDPNPIGICWHGEDKIHFGSWFKYLEHNLGKIPGNSIARTNPIFVSVGAFHDMESFRAFAQQTNSNRKRKTVNHLSVSLNDSNPFVQDEKTVIKVKDYKSNYLHGELALSRSDRMEHIAHAQFNRGDQKSEWRTEVSLDESPLVSTVKLQANLDAAALERETLIIRQSSSEVHEEVSHEHGFETWKVDNEILQLKAAPAFYPGLYSLHFLGSEWLDTSYPTLGPKLWWNPWSGGISSRLSAIRPYSLVKEETRAAFASLIDNKGNQWRGIRLSTSIIQNEEFKGLNFHQYFLTLPGSPVLCHVSEIQQETGKLFHRTSWQTAAFFKPGETMQDNWANFQNKAGDWTKLIAGKDENDFSVERNMVIGTQNLQEQLHIISNTESTKREAYINKELLLAGIEEQLTIPSGTTRFTTPNFYIFSDSVIPDFAQRDLQEIKFNI